MNYIFLDCEMGGKELQHSLLQAAFLVTDDTFDKKMVLNLLLKPDNGDYVINGESLAINQINLIEHDKKAISYKESSSILYEFLKSASQSGKDKVIPIGHGVRGDIKWITRTILSPGSWEHFCTYDCICTSVLFQFLKINKKIPQDMSGNLKTIAEYFQIKIDGQLHDALVDAHLTMEVYKNMLSLNLKS